MVEEVWKGVAGEALVRTESALGEAPQFEVLVESEERRYVNTHCELETSPTAVPAAGRLRVQKERLKVRAGQFVVRTLERYFADEREFMGYLVRLQNKLTVHHDLLADEIRRLHHALMVESQRARDRSLALHQDLERRVRELEHQVARLQEVQPTNETG